MGASSRDNNMMNKTGPENDLPAACTGDLHPMAVRGFELFDARQYWHAHEALETAWLEEPGPVRDLYRGVLQAGVVYLHVQRENYRGAVKVYHRCRRWLDPFPDHCRGLNVGQLRQDLETVFNTVNKLGPAQLNRFDHTLLKPIAWTARPHP
jgi:predicted metal-dependent hydrolase